MFCFPIKFCGYSKKHKIYILLVDIKKIGAVNMSNNGNEKSALRMIILVATFGGLLYGYDTGVVNGALPYMSREDQLNLTSLTEGLVTSALLLGAAFGAVISGKLSDRYGRRTTLLYSAILFFITTLGCTFAPNAAVMIAFRFLLGLAVGAASTIVPAYLAEVSPAERRGGIVTQNELMIVSGQLFAFTFNAIIGNTLGQYPNIWRFMLPIAAIPAVILFFGGLRLPESPRWLVAKGKKEKALSVLEKMRTNDRAKTELHDIEMAISRESEIKKASFKDLKITWIRRLILIGIGIAVIQQVTGANSIMYYGTEILKDSGLGTEAALIGNIANGIVSVLATFVGIWLLQRVGRRKMLMGGLMGITVTLILIGVSSLLLEGTTALPYVVLTLTVTFLAFQQGAVSPVTWLMLSEIFPLRLRGMGMGIAVFCLFTVNFLVGLTFPMLKGAIGLSSTFFIFAVLGVGALLFVKIWVPETKGMTLEQLEQKFRNYNRKKPKVLEKTEDVLNRNKESNNYL